MPGRLKAVASDLLRQAGTYGDLVSADLAAGTRSLLQRVWAAVALAVSALLALQLACVLVISATWDTPNRWLALGGLLAFFAVVAVGAGLLLGVLRRRRPSWLSSTALEWQKDRALLAERLAPAPAASALANGDGGDRFPRSQTFRWLIAKPARGWLGSALLTGALARLPVGRVLAGWVFGRKH